MAARRRNEEVVQGKRPQPMLIKLFSGFFLFAILFIILIIPMVIFSSINPVLDENPIFTARLKLSLIDATGQPLLLYESVDDGSDLKAKDGKSPDEVKVADEPLIIIPPFSNHGFLPFLRNVVCSMRRLHGV